MAKRGRKLKVASPEDMERMIDEYLTGCEDSKRPVTLTGALLHMGIYSRDTLGAYEEREGFAGPVKKLRAIVERTYEERLHGNNPTGAIFALKNMGWSDRQQVDHGGEVAIRHVERKIVDPGNTDT